MNSTLDNIKDDTLRRRLSCLVGVLAAFVAACATLAVAQPASAHEGHEHDLRKDTTCKGDFRKVAGQGRSCPVGDGLWKVRLRDGTTVTTHGPDAAPKSNGQSGVYSPDAVARNPVCSTSNYFRAIIAVPADIAGDKTAASFRGEIQKANGILYQAAVESGSPNGANFRFLCDSTGAIRVDVVRLSTPWASATWSTILSDLEAYGYDRTTEKYAVYYDYKLPNMTCGQGSYLDDERDSGSNRNNVGPSYAVVNNCDSVGTLLHEMGHNLGAVQYNAPYTTGDGESNGAHCWEYWDIMCYNDGADKDPGYLVGNCGDFDHFDCRHDTYFDAKIGVGQGGGAGSYIDTRWNIGECYVAFVVNAACGGSGGDTTRPTVTNPVQSVSPGSQMGTTSVPVRVNWSGSDSGGSGLARYRLYQAADGGAWNEVTLPSAQSTSVLRNLEPGHAYKFWVVAVDGAGNSSDWQAGGLGPRFSVDAHQETSSAITYGGTWTRFQWSPAYGGYQKTSGKAGATARIAFTGRDVAWVAANSTNRGQAWIYVDGVYQRTVSLYSASTVAKRVMYSYHWPTSGSHTMTVKVVGTSGRPSVDVDAFAVLR